MTTQSWLIALWLVGSMASSIQAQNPTKAIELINKAIQAHGGVSPLEKLYTAQWKGRGLMFRDDKDNKPLAFFGEWSAVLPSKYHYVYAFKGAGGNLPVTTGLIGDKAWRTLRPHQGADDMPEHRAKIEMEEAHAWYVSRLVPLLTNEYQLMLLPAVQRDQQTVVGLKADRKGYRSIYLYFHRQQNLLTYMDRKIQDPETKQEILQETRYKQFKKMGGALLPQSITIRQGNKLYMELDISSVTPVASLPESLFQKPAESKD